MKYTFVLALLPSLLCQEDPDISHLLCNTAGGEGVLYQGQCRDPAQDGLCGADALGERLFVTEAGEVRCDCEEGWLRLEGRCHQEFTSAVCSQNLILNIGSVTNRRYRLKTGQTHNCVRNPCEDDTLPLSLPHSTTYEKGLCHDISSLRELGGCELCVSNPDVDLSPLKCCSPSNRTECCKTSAVELPSVIIEGKRKCRNGHLYSRRRGGCLRLFG